MRSIAAALFFIVSALFISSCGTTKSLSLEQTVDRIMMEFNRSNGPGAAVAVMKNDSVIFQKAYGLASVKDSTAITTVTNFRLASVTKQFTAMCIMILREEGKLSFGDKIMKFFPNFPLYGSEITVQHLLNHTSGLVDYESVMPDSQTVQVLDKDCLQLMFKVDSLYFPPGTKYQYSNTGYTLLALIVEKTSGKRFSEFLKENIFDVVGMPTSVAFENGISVVPNRAYGHSRIDGVWLETDQSSTSAVLGDGGIYSNVEEMSKWISALWKYQLIPEQLQQLAWTDTLLNDGTPIDYGMGWHTESYNGIRHPHHGGSTKGFRNHIFLFPNSKSMVIILSNRNEGNPIIEAKKIAELMLTIK